MTPQALKDARKTLGLTQADLATAVGVHPVTVAKWEGGVHAIPPPAAKLIERLVAEH